MSTRPRLPSWLTGSGVIAIGMGVMNLGTYGFTLLAARLLGPKEYGALAALMGLMLVTAVVQLGLQATAARRVSTHPHRLEETEAEVVRASWKAAWALVGITVVTSPLVVLLLEPGGPLGGYAAALLLAASCLPLTLMGAQAGLLQGERRWYSLATVYAAVGLGRVLLGLGGMVWREDVTGAMVGVTLGNVVPTLIGWVALRRRVPAPSAAPEHESPEPATGVLTEVAHNSHALLAFFALTNTDVILARILFDKHDSGLYAGGLILAKAVLFLPQFVVVIAFPNMNDPAVRRRMEISALGVVLAMGLVATAGAGMLRSLAVVFVGGPEYADLEPAIWAFAAIGTLWAMEQLMVYSTVARQSRRSVGVIWLGLVALVVLAQPAHTVAHLLEVVAAVHVVVLGVLVVLSQTAHRRHRPTAVDPGADAPAPPAP
ncbi:lipopolysaccharide biosynthesis protein [Nocardioides marmoribigeumensis]|nr:oligosaccharide flippase family protein [Nocardioides marmoribigeumensis]